MTVDEFERTVLHGPALPRGAERALRPVDRRQPPVPQLVAMPQPALSAIVEPDPVPLDLELAATQRCEPELRLAAAPAAPGRLSSSVLPWLLMFPAMGYGFFGIHGPEGTRLFRTSLAAHTMYGLGLWLAVRWPCRRPRAPRAPGRPARPRPRGT